MLTLALILCVLVLTGVTVVVYRKQRDAAERRRIVASLPPALYNVVAQDDTTELGTHFERQRIGPNTYRLTQHLKPIAFERNGALHRATNLLTASGDADMPIGCDELCQLRVDPRIAGKSPLFHFGKGSSFVKVALLNANNVSGTVSGNKATFVNAWNGADLHLANGGHFVSFVAPLKAGHPRSFSFRLDSHAGFDPLTLRFGQDFHLSQPVLVKDMLTVPLKWVVTQSGGKYILTVNLPAGDWTGWTLDPTFTAQPDGTAGLDVMLEEDTPASNYGLYTYLYIGNYAAAANSTVRTLIKFDLTDLPAGALISAATLSLYCTQDLSANAATFAVYRQKRAWLEGTRTNSADSPRTGATWNWYDTTNNWSTAGGFGADDCEQTDIGSRSMTATETMNEFKNWSLTPTTKAALDSGNGWLMKATVDQTLNSQNCYRFQSSDTATAAQRPKLVVVYTLPGGGARRMMVPDLGYMQYRGA